MALHGNPNIFGIPCAGNHYKVNFDADDALLVLTKPITLPNLQVTLDNFSVFGPPNKFL